MDPENKTVLSDVLQTMWDEADDGLMVYREGHWQPAGNKDYRDDMKTFALTIAELLGVEVNDYTEDED